MTHQGSDHAFNTVPMSQKTFFILVFLLVSAWSVVAADLLYRLRGEIHQRLVVRFGSADVAFVGDSIMGGGGVWDWRLGHYFSFRTWNFGQGGAPTEIIRWFATKRVPAKMKPRIVCVMAGSNDINGDLDATWTQYRQMLEELELIVEHIIVTSTPPTTDPNSSEWCRSLNDKLRDYASTHDKISFIDLWPFITDGHVLKPEMTVDGGHFSQAAYRHWSRLLKERLQALQ
jgi:lysophospholipase L1-like esterase